MDQKRKYAGTCLNNNQRFTKSMFKAWGFKLGQIKSINDEIKLIQSKKNKKKIIIMKNDNDELTCVGGDESSTDRIHSRFGLTR